MHTPYKIRDDADGGRVVAEAEDAHGADLALRTLAAEGYQPRSSYEPCPASEMEAIMEDYETFDAARRWIDGGGVAA